MTYLPISRKNEVQDCIFHHIVYSNMSLHLCNFLEKYVRTQENYAVLRKTIKFKETRKY